MTTPKHVTIESFRQLKEIEATSALEAGALGFSARLLAQLSLPYREPAEGLTRWERHNGAYTLTIRPSLIKDLTTGELRDGYPYGVIPRYVLTYLATAAVQTTNPRIDLGPSMGAFLSSIGLGRSGRDMRRFKDQMQRLMGTVMQISTHTKSLDGTATIARGSNMILAAEYELWLPERDRQPDEQFELWPSYILLSDPFFLSILEAPVPVDLRAMKYLSGSPLRIDIYIWLTYRMSYLSTPPRSPGTCWPCSSAVTTDAPETSRTTSPASSPRSWRSTPKRASRSTTTACS